MNIDTIIIGSGISGLLTLKHLIEEGNTNVLVLDKNPEPFGVWNIKNHPSVTENTYTVSSKLYMTISDFPFPEDAGEFPHHSVILDYYKSYAYHFNLYKYLRQNCTVTSIKKKENKWVVKTSNETYYSNYVVVSTGAVNDCPNIPTDEMYSRFSGKMYHSYDYEKIKNVKGKNILIVGGSDTAVDSAVELLRNNKVTVSIKNGAWFQNRTDGISPADSFYNRVTDFIVKNNFFGKYLFDFLVHNASDLEFYWGDGGSGIDIWQPKCNYLNSIYIKSREVIDYVAKGAIIPENGIVNIDGNLITFETGHSHNYDIILFCTGYKPLNCMKFIDHEISDSLKYKQIFYDKDPSIMFVGFVRPYLTSIVMLAELQSRWVANIICKNLNLPSYEIMHRTAEIDDEKQKKEFPCNYNRIRTIVDPYDYANMIGYNINALNMGKLLFSDPVLFWKSSFGSWNHHIFRLNDPDEKKCQNAVNNINNEYKKYISRSVEKSTLIRIIQLILLLIIIFLLLQYILKNINVTKIKYMFNKIFKL
jgi:NADH dehydrogenase FAD-containing subunit